MDNKCKQWLERKVARIQSLEMYGEERTNESIAKQYQLPVESILKLNYNENLFLPREKLVPWLKEVAEECDLRIYPQEEENKLKKAISAYLKVPEESIALGNSSDEVMDRIIRIFLEKGDKAVTFMPTFSIFKYCIKYYSAEVVGVSLRRDFSLDLDAMRSAFAPDTKLLYLCSPNNPTANQLKLEEIVTLTESFPGMVMVDEAYAEYADYSAVPLIEKYENLIVLRTFSKAFGLAGIRLGYAVANPKIAQTIDMLPTPYAVGVISLSMGRKLLENLATVQRYVDALKSERTKLIERLNRVDGIEAFDSKTNFVLFNSAKPYGDVYLNLLKQGIVIKKLGKLLQYENCLRTTVGTPEMNKRLIEALTGYFGDKT